MLKFSQLSTTRKMALLAIIVGMVGVTAWIWPSLLFAKKHWPITLLIMGYIGVRVFMQYSKTKADYKLHIQHVTDALQDGPKTLSELARGINDKRALNIVEHVLAMLDEHIEQVSDSPVRYQWSDGHVSD